MIAFREGWDPNNKDIEIFINKLKEVLNSKSFDPIELEEDCSSFHECINISDLMQLIYENLYQNNHEIINITINKNENNSLDANLDIIK